MKGIKKLVIAASILADFVSVGVAIAIPTATTGKEVVILAPPTQNIGGQQVWSDQNWITDHALSNDTDPTAVIKARAVANALELRAANPTPTAFTSAEGKFSRDMLKITNDLRAIHGAPPVVWNKILATFAARQAKRCNFAHSGGPYGENLAGGSYSNPVYYPWLWYSEVRSYDYNNPGFSGTTGHFTQLVWKGTKQMGCAFVAGCSNLSYQVWCEYTPAGNVSPVDYYRANVARPSRGIPPAPPFNDAHYQ
ncbi:Latisemin [Orbilia brochopaga]|nr:Latisemin [Drechslerella brochopaga]